MSIVIICPYYIKDSCAKRIKNKRTPYIKCESLKMRFKDDDSLRKYRKCYCEKYSWEQCPLAAQINEMYEKGTLK